MHLRLLLVCALALGVVVSSIRIAEEETGGSALEADNGLSALAQAVAGDYAPDPNAQIINDDSGGTSVVLSNQNSVHEKTDDTWKMHLVREAQQKSKQENKRKAALEEKRKKSYEEANKQDVQEEKKKKQEEGKEKESQNEKNEKDQQNNKPTPENPENSVSINHMCSFSKDPACKGHFQNRGLSGMIMRVDQYDKNPFNTGGDFNKGWKWSHPYLCCATSDDANIKGLYVLAKQCPKGTTTAPFVGHLLLKKDYDKNPFTEGGDFNDGWRWTHPILCQVEDRALLDKSNDWCLPAATCPQGWVDHSFGGFIVVNKHYARQPFHTGGQFNDDWKWAHPKMCCRA